MKIINVVNKLEEMGVSLDSIVMGDFDYIGEFTAKRQRKSDDPNYAKYGAFYRSSYERGIILYYLVRQFNLSSFLEVGFGRGYSTFCVAKALYDTGANGKIVSVDPVVDESFVSALGGVFPKEWFQYIQLVRGTSEQALPTIEGSFDIAYIDGDHSYQSTKKDWELVKDRCSKFVLFDDYHESSKNDPGIQCSKAIDEIDWKKEGFQEPELLILDRRMFVDDRQLTDEQIDYGQVLFTREGTQQRNDW